MADKTFNARFIHKHDTAANWLKATNFIPQKGEIVVYDIDADYNYERFKIGDGKTEVNSLPFADGAIKNYIDTEIATLSDEIDTLAGENAQIKETINAIDHPVDSVNGKTGAVVLTASDVKADPSGSAVAALGGAKAYTDAEIAEWVGDETVSVQISGAMAKKADADHTHDDIYYTETEIDTKLSGKSDTSHTHSTYVNQNAFSNIKVGTTTVAADSTTDTITLVAGSNVTITPDTTNDKITIAATDTVYTHPNSGVTAGTYKSVTVNAQGHITSGSNPTTLSGYGITDAAAKSHGHSAASASADGFMSASDKVLLDNLETWVGGELVSKQIEDAIATKADVGHTHTAAQVGADPSGSAASALSSAKSYTDTKISELINSAPTTLDTLGEIATAMEENDDVVAALETAIGTKANASDLTSHTGNKSNPHGVTLSQLGVTATAAELNYVDGVTSNVQTQLNAKVSTSRKINGKALGADITLSASDVGADASGAANTALTSAKSYTDAEIAEWVGDKTVSVQISSAMSQKADADHTHDNRYYTEAEINDKLSGKSDKSHTHSEYVNQNAFSHVKVGTTTVSADSITDTITLVAGNNITITPDATNDKITIAAADTKYTHPNSGVAAGTYKSVTVNAQGHVTGGTNPTTLSGYGITDAAAKSHGHDAATSSVDGFMSASDKTLLDNLETWVGGESVSEQIEAAIASKADTGHTHDNYASKVTTTGSGNAITAISQSGNTITATKGATFLTSETNLSKGTDSTATKTLAHGGTFTAVTDTAVSGHKITDTTTTYTLPSETTLSKGTTSGTGNAVTDISVNGHTITLTKGSTFSLSSHKHTASEVGADASGSAASALADAKTYIDNQIDAWVGDETVATQISSAISSSETRTLSGAKSYTDAKISDLINSAPTTLDTLGEIAEAMAENADIVEDLEAAIGSKANASDLTSHTGNKSNPHGVSLSQLGVTATAAELNYVDGVTSSVQTQLNAKVPNTRKVNGKALSADVTLSASDVGADAQGAANTSLTNAKSYTDNRIADMVGDDTVANQISDAVDAVTLTSLGVTATAAELNKLDGVTATTTELNYVDGVTSNIQNQLNAKASSDHTHSVYANQNAFSNVKVGNITIVADSMTDTLTLAGDNVTITPDATNDKVTIGITKDNVVAALGYAPPTADTKVTVDTALSSTSTNPVQNKVVNAAISNLNTLVGDTAVATQISTAVATKADTGHTHDDRYYTETEMDSKLNGKLSLSGGTLTGNLTLDNSATAQSKEPHIQWATVGGNKPYTGFAHDQSDGTFIICSMEKDTTTNGVKYYKNGLAIGGGSGNLFWKGSKVVTVTDQATASAVGLMSAEDKKKLDGIATGATKVTVDSALSSTSTNPVQNKIVNAAISNLNTLVGDTAVATQISNAVAKKADTSHTHDDRYYTETEIDTKLSGKSDTSHTHSAYVNQNAFSKITVGNTTISADTATDTLTLVGGNVTITPDATNDKVTIDITKENVVAALGYAPPAVDTKVTVDSALSSSSTNPVQNKIVNAAITNLNALVGDTAVATQISNAVSTKADSGHTHDDRYYTESEINTKLNAKANSSHGNHVPDIETANNARFLRNDNTWQTVTPDNIGAAKANHGTHVSYSTTAPVMDGTAFVGSAPNVARSDHRHPTDTSRASASSVTTLQNLVGDTAVSTQISNAISNHQHVIADISNIVISATEPSSPTTGMLWFDIS